MRDLSNVLLPTQLYRLGGIWPGPPTPDGKSTTFDILPCLTLDEVRAGLDAGWSLTVPEACLGIQEPLSVVEVADAAQDATDDDAPPTRDEMVAQAEKLALRVDRRWSDETLLAKINAAMAAPSHADEDPI